MTALALIGGLALLALFIGMQARTPDPLMPLALWRARGFAPTVLIAGALYACWVGGVYFISLTLQQVIGYSSLTAAVAMLPLAIGGFAFSTLAGRLIKTVGPRRLMMVGLSAYAVGSRPSRSSTRPPATYSSDQSLLSSSSGWP